MSAEHQYVGWMDAMSGCLTAASCCVLHHLELLQELHRSLTNRVVLATAQDGVQHSEACSQATTPCIDQSLKCRKITSQGKGPLRYLVLSSLLLDWSKIQRTNSMIADRTAARCWRHMLRKGCLSPSSPMWNLPLFQNGHKRLTDYCSKTLEDDNALTKTGTLSHAQCHEVDVGVLWNEAKAKDLCCEA